MIRQAGHAAGDNFQQPLFKTGCQPRFFCQVSMKGADATLPSERLRVRS
ncbi:hypothetical protein E0I56_005720 [Escherichia coli]|nr:hypothetical protein [Escherichia coli]